jgi:hypothetical protein
MNEYLTTADVSEMEYVSSEVLFAKQFDIEDPNLFNKNAALTNVAKAKLEILKESSDWPTAICTSYTHVSGRSIRWFE